MKSITPVILAGGTGTRLWPLSRKSYPKQFSNIFEEYSLYQQCALRFSSSLQVQFDNPVVLTNVDFRFLVAEQLNLIGVDPGSIIIEPEGKNTAPAILAASLYLNAKDKNAVILVAPSDHEISDAQSFHASVSKGLSLLEDGKIVTFGIAPTRPETGYGYLELAGPPNGNAVCLKSFSEKPSEEDAKTMVSSGNFLWNSGIFLFKAADMISAFESYLPTMMEPVREAIQRGETDLDFFRLESEAWARCDNISIDYAIMENAKNLSVVPLSAGWTDLGSWDVVWERSDKDENLVAAQSNCYALDCKRSLIRSEEKDITVVAIGLDDIVTVAMRDAVLVARKDRVQDIKVLLQELRSDNVAQAENFSKEHRPWGWYETLIIDKRFQVKRIFVKPGAALSLQSHHHRSEHWVVVEGTAKITVDEDVKLLTEGQSVFIELGAVHRLENPGKVPMILIEVQTGTYLGEDDIVRLDDIYARI